MKLMGEQMGESARINKTYEADLEVADGKREVLAVISTDSIDRDGEVVVPKGLKKKNYAGNPVVMVNHDYRSLPIGKALWVKADGDKVLAKYYVSDKTQTARDVFGLLQDGIINAHSIGFVTNPTKASAPSYQEVTAHPKWKGAKLVHREWEMLEFSPVGIPANPEALTLAVSKGYSPETIDLLSGRKGATEEAATEAVVAVQRQMEVKTLTRKEIISALAKKIEGMSLAVDVDKAIAIAFDRLTA